MVEENKWTIKVIKDVSPRVGISPSASEYLEEKARITYRDGVLEHDRLSSHSVSRSRKKV